MRWTANLLAAAMFLFAIGLNGSDIGLPSFLTAKRLGLVLLTVGISVIPYKYWRVPWAVRKTAWVLIGIGLWGLVSTLWNASVLGRGISLSLGWFFTAYAVLASAVLLFQVIPDYKHVFFEKMAWWGSIAPFFLIIFVIIKRGPAIFLEFYTLRLYLDDISVGMSRLMNGFVFLSLIPLGIITGSITSRKSTYFFCLTGMGLFLALALVSGSRQTVGAMGLLIPVMLVTNLISNKYFHSTNRLNPRKQWALAIILLLGLALLLRGLFAQETLQKNIEKRFVERTAGQLDENQIRVAIVRTAWKTSLTHPLLGVGPGEFADLPSNSTGYPTHNGYLCVLVEYGFFPLFFLVALLAGNIFDTIHRREAVRRRGNGDLFKLFLPFCLVFPTWMITFNDLARENFFWIISVILLLSSRFPDKIIDFGVKDV